MLIDGRNHSAERSFGRTSDTGAEKSVDDNVAILELRKGGPSPLRVDHRLGDFPPPFQVGRGVSLYVARITKEIHRDASAVFPQMSRGHEAVTPVVSLSTKNEDAPPGEIREQFLNEFGNTLAGVLHEGEAGDTVFRCGEPIDFAHLSGAQNFHAAISLVGDRASKVASSRAEMSGHAGDNHGHIIRLLGGAGPLLDTGNEICCQAVGRKAALPQNLCFQAFYSVFFAIDAFRFGESIAESYQQASGFHLDRAL